MRCFWRKRLREDLVQMPAAHFDAILLDFGLPDNQGLSTFGRLITEVHNVPVIVMLALEDELNTIEAV